MKIGDWVKLVRLSAPESLYNSYGLYLNNTYEIVDLNSFVDMISLKGTSGFWLMENFDPVNNNSTVTISNVGNAINVASPIIFHGIPIDTSVPPVVNTVIYNKVCECGSSKVGSPNHSAWCPVYER